MIMGDCTYMTEAAYQRDIALHMSDAGATLFRNNTGMAYRRDGTPVRFGLCPGSSDLIGWYPVTIKPEHVGHIMAVFLAIEVKRPDGKGRVTPAQQNFLEQLHCGGGISILAQGESPLILRHILEST
jgi:hypothetical protein